MTDNRMLGDLAMFARETNHNWNVVKEQMYSNGHDNKSANAWRKIWHKRCKDMDTTNATIDSTVNRVQYSLGADDVQSSERVIPLLDEELHDKRAILLAHKYNPDEWEIVNARNTFWDGQTKANGKETFYSSKITVKPKSSVDIQDIEQIFSRLKVLEHPMPICKKSVMSERTLELTLADIHLNRQSWNGTTGKDYDLHIACERVYNVVRRIVERIGDEHFDNIIVPVGQDLFNSDGSKGETHNGTPQDNDSRFAKVFERALQLYSNIIEELRLHCSVVRVVCVSGNHDEDSSMMFTHALNAWFRACPDVIVDTGAIKRKCITFGDNMLVLGHFDEETKRLVTIIPMEFSEQWGKTKYREAHGSHLHKESVIEYGGFVLRRSPTIVEIDEWSYGKGYGNPPRHCVYVWGKKGVEEVWYQTI